MIFLSPKPEKTSPRASSPPRHRPPAAVLGAEAPAAPNCSGQSSYREVAGSALAPPSLGVKRFSLAGKVACAAPTAEGRGQGALDFSRGDSRENWLFTGDSFSPARTPGSSYHPGAFGSLLGAKPTLSAELSPGPVRTKPRENWTASTTPRLSEARARCPRSLTPAGPHPPPAAAEARFGDPLRGAICGPGASVSGKFGNSGLGTSGSQVPSELGCAGLFPTKKDFRELHTRA